MLIIAVIVAIVISWLTVKLVRVVAARRGWLDKPNDRSSHDVPTPRGGGIAIVGVTLVGTIGYVSLFGQMSLAWSAVLAAAGFVAAVSWIDDIRSLPNSIRFAVHLSAAVVAMAIFGTIRQIDLPHVMTIHTSWAAAPLTICWIVGVTNIYNFMDGIDGIAAVQSIVAATAWVLIGISVDDPILTATAAFLAASSAGFLFHNWAPAKIFMGDVGSAFTGYLFSLFVVERGHNPVIPFAGALAIWPFVFDSTFTLLRRLRKGENITQAHRSHLYQRLVRCGWSHAAVASLYGALAVTGSIFAIALVRDMPGWEAVYMVVPGLAISLYMLVRHAERRRILRLDRHWNPTL